MTREQQIERRTNLYGETRTVAENKVDRSETKLNQQEIYERMLESYFG